MTPAQRPAGWNTDSDGSASGASLSALSAALLGKSPAEIGAALARNTSKLPDIDLRSCISNGVFWRTIMAVGGNDDAPNELFDEASGRWFELPHPMAQTRRSVQVVSLPAAAVTAGAAAAAGAAAGP